MKRLLLVELTRLRARRAVLLLLLAAVVVPALIFASSAWNTRPVSTEEQQRVAQQVEEARNDPAFQRDLQRCARHPERYGIEPTADAQEFCAEMMLPQPEWYLTRSPLDLESEYTGSGPGVVVVLAVLLMLIGTTFVGHDWNTRSMSNQLLFEPRRIRVWAAKGSAVLLVGVVASIVVIGGFWLAMTSLAGARGIDTPDRVMDLITDQAIRGGLLASFAALGGYALTMLFRSTVATLGVLFAAAVVGPLLLALMGLPDGERWMPHNNVAAVLQDGITYYDSSAYDDCSGPEGCGQQTLTPGEAGRYFGGMLLLVSVPSVLLFQRRDVP